MNSNDKCTTRISMTKDTIFAYCNFHGWKHSRKIRQYMNDAAVKIIIANVEKVRKAHEKEHSNGA